MVHEKRLYPYFSHRDGKYKVQTVTYILWFENEQLIDVRNEYGFSIEKDSECFEYFLLKYRTLNTKSP